MRTADFDYDLPEELIAQEPSQVRGEDRMLVLDPATSDVTVGMFESLPDYLRPGDAIVLNNTRALHLKALGRGLRPLLISRLRSAEASSRFPKH